MIAVSGLDMAAWDALAKAAEHAAVRSSRRLGRPGAGLQQQRPVAQRRTSSATEAVELRDEGGFTGLKLRLGRERSARDLAAIDAVREAVGDDMELMVDFNQGLNLGEALAALPHDRRSRPRLDRGADRLRQSRRLRAARGRAEDAAADRRELLWPARRCTRPCSARPATS